MGKPASVIEINGNRYDAASGKIIAGNKNPGQVIDGFVKNRAKPKPQPAAKKTEVAKAKKTRPARTVKSSAKSVHQRTRRSETLRRTVSRPSLRIKEASKTFAKPVIAAAGNILPERERRAKLVDKHDKVSRFGIPRPLKEPVSTEKKPTPAVQVVTATARPKSAVHAAAIAPPASMIASASHQKLERMLDAALLNAKPHKQMSGRANNPVSRFTALPNWLSWTIIILAALIAAALIIWRDVPAVAVKVASTRAGVNASMPGYTPVGFSFSGPVTYHPGSVSITFKDKMNVSQSYELVENRSSWNSSSLSANVLGASQQYQTSQVGGTTVYIYGSSSNATWVNNGIWFTIQNKAGLSSDQLLRIVQSL